MNTNFVNLKKVENNVEIKKLLPLSQNIEAASERTQKNQKHEFNANNLDMRMLQRSYQTLQWYTNRPNVIVGHTEEKLKPSEEYQEEPLNLSLSRCKNGSYEHSHHKRKIDV